MESLKARCGSTLLLFCHQAPAKCSAKRFLARWQQPKVWVDISGRSSSLFAAACESRGRGESCARIAPGRAIPAFNSGRNHPRELIFTSHALEQPSIIHSGQTLRQKKAKNTRALSARGGVRVHVRRYGFFFSAAAGSGRRREKIWSMWHHQSCRFRVTAGWYFAVPIFFLFWMAYASEQSWILQKYAFHPSKILTGDREDGRILDLDFREINSCNISLIFKIYEIYC